jgi:Caspase domain
MGAKMRLKPTGTAALVGMALASFGSVAQAPLDLRVALVVGNAAYAHIQALGNPVNDARAMSLALRKLGFEVIDLVDGNRQQMQQAIAQTQTRLKGQQAVAMFYYAGHGLQLDWRNYMVPVDARIGSAADVPRQTVDISQVLTAFKEAGTRMNILVLDACRDNPFTASASGKGLAQLDAPPGTYLAYSTAPGNVAEDGDEDTGHGLFTQFLVKELQRPARIEDVFKRVRLQVRQRSEGRQIPWDSSSLEEDFSFNDGKKFTLTPGDFLSELRQARAGSDLQRRESEAAKAQEEALQRQREQAQDRLQREEDERRKALSPEAARERRFAQEKADWDRISQSQDARDFYDFLLKYPSGVIAVQASAAIERLQVAKIQAQPDQTGMVQTILPERFRVGDEYHYQRRDNLTGKVMKRFTRRVTRIENGLVYISNDGAEEIRTLDGANVLVVSSATSYRYDPPKMEVPVDGLVVGRKWTGMYTETDMKDRRQFLREDQFRILSQETLEVAAGKYNTFKIEDVSYNQFGTRASLVYWIEPGWGLPVRTDREVLNARVNLRISETVELLARTRVKP